MAEPPPKKTTIAIIGAGIAGPFFALTILSHPLLSQLYKPVIYERLPEENEAGGAAVALTSNALFPLYELGLKDALNAISCETQRILISRSLYPSVEVRVEVRASSSIKSSIQTGTPTSPRVCVS
jgi:2-polyprenyl-6-methoxyphenol hydroxylase-like FAD-dependent oxidoreductase